MQSACKPCVVGRLNDGTVTVDGKPYPMAESVVATEDQIHRAMKATAKVLAECYKGKTHRDTSAKDKGDESEAAEAPISYANPLIIISVLKGSYIFTADMVRYLQDEGLCCVCDFIRLASYNDGTQSTGTVTIHSLPKFQHLKGKHVLVLEDVCDSGRTLKFLKSFLVERHSPKSIKFCVLVNKHAEARKVHFVPEYACLPGPNKYIIGYGFEVNDRYRDFRHVFVLKDGEAGRYPNKL